jgi:hypothetical protein
VRRQGSPPATGAIAVPDTAGVRGLLRAAAVALQYLLRLLTELAELGLGCHHLGELGLREERQYLAYGADPHLGD